MYSINEYNWRFIVNSYVVCLHVYIYMTVLPTHWVYLTLTGALKCECTYILTSLLLILFGTFRLFLIISNLVRLFLLVSEPLKSLNHLVWRLTWVARQCFIEREVHVRYTYLYHSSVYTCRQVKGTISSDISGTPNYIVYHKTLQGSGWRQLYSSKVLVRYYVNNVMKIIRRFSFTIRFIPCVYNVFMSMHSL